MEKKDVLRVFEIEKKCFSDPWSLRIFTGELKKRGYNYSLIAEDAETGSIIGYIFYWIFHDDEVHINNIAVHPDYQRKGIAKVLLQKAIEEGKEKQARSVTLEVRESNLPAITFYQRYGFIQEGRRRNYYTKPKEDALLFRYNLNHQNYQ